MSRCLYRVGDVFDKMAEIPDGSVDLIVTSPPFLALRSYLSADHPDKHKEIGSEATPAAFLTTMLALTREWRRILAPHGSIAVELGDTYSGVSVSAAGQQSTNDEYNTPGRSRYNYMQPVNVRGKGVDGWPLAKSLCLIPSLYAGSLAYGHNLLNPDDRIDPWRIRNLIVWHRPNPPVGALGDKVRPATSYITTACVSDKRWFDLDAERTAVSANTHSGGITGARQPTNGEERGGMTAKTLSNPAGAPPLDCWIEEPGWSTVRSYGDVWTIPTQPYKGAHYATYPPALPRRLIRLMCPRQVCVVCGEPRRRITGDTDEYASFKAANRWDSGGKITANLHRPDIDFSMERVTTLGWSDCGCWWDKAHDHFRRGHVLDPFAGSGTTLIAAAEQGRDATTGIDLDPRNLDLARQRIGLFLEEESSTA